jgi:soluble lytic murein transglycosylase-like protein
MQLMTRTLFALLLMFAALPAFAKAHAPADPRVLSCINEAAARYEIGYPLLLAIAKQESSLHPGVVHRNAPTKKNPAGSDDIGLFGINEGWFPVLQKYGITRASLFDPCINAHVAAWIVWENKKTYGNTWKAIGAFNAKSTDKQQDYIRHVWKQLRSVM